MRTWLASLVLVGCLVAVGAVPVSAAADVDRLTGVGTVLAVRVDEDFPVRSLMRATCDSVQFVRLADGRGIEKLHCSLSSEPVMIPAFQGQPPTTAFVHGGGACEWTSDYWFARDESIVMASAYSYVVTPSGMVNVTAWYPAEPLTCA